MPPARRGSPAVSPLAATLTPPPVTAYAIAGQSSLEGMTGLPAVIPSAHRHHAHPHMLIISRCLIRMNI